MTTIASFTDHIELTVATNLTYTQPLVILITAAIFVKLLIIEFFITEPKLTNFKDCLELIQNFKFDSF